MLDEVVYAVKKKDDYPSLVWGKHYEVNYAVRCKFTIKGDKHKNRLYCADSFKFVDEYEDEILYEDVRCMKPKVATPSYTGKRN